MKYKLNFKFLAEVCDAFWRQHPALLYGLASLLGCGAALSGHPSLSFPILLLYAPLLIPSRQLQLRLLLSLIVLITTYGACALTYRWPTLPTEGIRGIAEISISTLALENSSFGEHWVYEGELQRFLPTEILHAPVQVRISTRDSAARPPANGAYRVFGTLKQRHGGYQLKVGKGAKWTPIPGSWSLAEWRYDVKQAVGRKIEQWIRNPRSATFITGLLTGDFSDRQMRSALGRFGLQHVMAISGFHFAILASLLGLTLGALLPRTMAVMTMIAILSGYFIFLGPGASILRAWVGAMVLLVGQLFAKRARGLNSLGLAMLVLLWIDPTLSQTIAFQLSFLATAAILLFYPAIEAALQAIFPKRSLSQVVTLTLWEQHGVIVLALLRGALSLGIAVHLAMIPMTLYYFQKFPVLSIAFNLFYPFLVSVSMLLLLLALPLQLLFAPMADLIHMINSAYTQWVLSIAMELPTSVDVFWRVTEVPTTAIVVYLSVLGAIGVAVFYRMEKARETREIFAFL